MDKQYSKVGEELNKFSLSGFVRYSIKNLTTTDKKKPFVSFLLTQYREAGDPKNLKKFSKTFQILVFDEKLVDMLRVIDQQIKVEVFGNIGIKVEQVGAYKKAVPTLIATQVTITQDLGIPFQVSGKPDGATTGKNYETYKAKANTGDVDDAEIKALEAKVKEQEAKIKAQRANAILPQPVIEDEDLPF